MAETFDFVTTDAAQIYTAIIGTLMDEVGEPLYPGDERRIFGEALVAVLVALYNEFNDKMKQRTLQYARGPVLDAIGDRYGLTRAQPSHAAAMFRFSVEVAHRPDRRPAGGQAVRRCAGHLHRGRNGIQRIYYRHHQHAGGPDPVHFKRGEYHRQCRRR